MDDAALVVGPDVMRVCWMIDSAVYRRHLKRLPASVMPSGPYTLGCYVVDDGAGIYHAMNYVESEER